MTENENEPNDCDVLIAGAGPIGQILALLLAQQGLRVTVVERWAQPYPLPRAVALSHDNLRVLYQLGLREELDPLLEPWGQEGHVFKVTDASGQTLAESQITMESESGFANMSGFSQPDLERLLEQRVQVNPLIEQRRGFSLEALSDDEPRGVTGTIRPHSGLAPIPGEPEHIRAAYVVGCDGANSTVRSLLGTEMTDLDFSHDWLVVDVLPHTPPDWLPYACQHLDPARSTTLVPSGPGRRRWEFMVMPDDDQNNVDTDENSWRLLKAWGIHPGNADLVRHARYTFRGRWANEWRRGRVLLAGDAAHQMPPFMGQGINSGIRDAAGLAWRLALLVRGQGRDSLLDDYATERSAHVAQIIEQTVFIGRMFCATDPKECAERDAMIKAMGTLDIQDASKNWRLQGGTLREDDVSGTLSVQARVGARAVLLDEAIPPPGFLLLGRDRDPAELLSPDQRAAWSRLQGRSVHFGPGGLTDTEGKYAAWFDRLDAAVVLVRPDFQVFGGAHTPQDTDDLVNDLIQRVLGRQASSEKE
ncbi:bifunctional 3-(3-hydroxy-phenyl)propionate/3-hydroxycinnamic acid hydroxylase [Actinospica sp.]|uniref:bifunctional 3-(3-hydroxy-phenyl)propionate/3-hydroxycinnamic acid hydroxylase MhpA n=1 Tax=Actinospica sp. TaxID=1872142 RepID=UPI002C24E4DE|nr:bifunctional 3-(3-hydroxy-phenyl)propionate/3-hydroxycinnamic acid hydroxylase [Actinospica sp.]HWG25313.1 bifunctional 3-(3-hydroxy-phenyl)propionate/3-hydroxycinnamic acid hydroxylase [Actinospica sp.]